MVERPSSAAALLASGYEIDVAGERVPATAHLKAPYDAKRDKILA